MADLGLAQSVVARAGDPVLSAALRTLVDPFRSLGALPALAPPLEAPLPDGSPVWWFVLRCGWLLWPGSPPPVKSLLMGAAQRAAEEGAFRFAGNALDADALAGVAAVLCQRAGVGQGALEARVSARRAEVSQASAAGHLASHAALVALEGGGALLKDDVLAGQARGRLLDAMAAGTLDGGACTQALEAALLGGSGPSARLTREARRVLGTLQDPVKGNWNVRGVPQAEAVVTFHAVLLLMRGG